MALAGLCSHVVLSDAGHRRFIYQLVADSNVADIRVPAATMARVAGAEPGSPEGDVMATIGIAASGVRIGGDSDLFTFIGSAIMPLVPKFVTKAFGFILPAVFGAVYAELSRRHFKRLAC